MTQFKKNLVISLCFIALAVTACGSKYIRSRETDFQGLLAGALTSTDNDHPLTQNPWAWREFYRIGVYLYNRGEYESACGYFLWAGRLARIHNKENPKVRQQAVNTINETYLSCDCPPVQQNIQRPLPKRKIYSPRPEPNRTKPEDFSEILYDIVEPYLYSVPYRWGGTSINRGMDCSAFSRFVIRNFGIELPRTVEQQARVGRYVSPDNLDSGDLVFFDTSRRRRGVDHVGIYLREGYFVHSASPEGVTIDSLMDYRHPVIFAKRLRL